MSFRYLMKGDRLESPRDPTSGWLVYNPELVLGQVELVCLKAKTKQLVDYSQINKDLISGKLIQAREGMPALAPASQDDAQLDKRTGDASRLLFEAKSLSDRSQISIHQAFQEVRNTALASGEKPKSIPALYRLLQKQRNGIPLFSGDANKGNRTPRFYRSVDATIVRLAKELYLKSKSQVTMSKLVKTINDTIASCKAEADEIHVKSRSEVTQKYVRKVIREQITPNPSAFRLAREDVFAKTAIAATRMIIKGVLERVEQDAVHLPIVIMTPDGPFSNVWLVHAIDCCLSYPTGWQFVLGYPSESDGLKCIERTCFPKGDEFRKHGVDCALDLCGTPLLIGFDNGPEASGERIKRLSSIGIDTLHLKSRTPQAKPFIERLNRSLKVALETAPGSTRFEGKDGERDPIKEGDQLMNFEQLQTRIIRWYFESHIHTPLERHEWSDFHSKVKMGSTAAKRFEYLMSQGVPRPLSPTPTRWREATHLHQSAKLNRTTGLPYKQFNYKGEKLIYLFKKYGEVHVNFLVNPDDYREIFVQDGDGMPLVSLVEEFVEPTTPGYSFAQMAEFNTQRKERREEHPTKTSYDREMRDSDAAAAAAAKRPRAAERSKATSDKAKKDDAVRRAAKRPLSASQSADSPLGEFEAGSFNDLPRLTSSHKSSPKTPR